MLKFEQKLPFLSCTYEGEDVLAGRRGRGGLVVVLRGIEGTDYWDKKTQSLGAARRGRGAERLREAQGGAHGGQHRVP